MRIGVSRVKLSILFSLVVLGFVLVGCVPPLEEETPSECERKIWQGLSRSGNGICDREYTPSRVCLEAEPPACTGVGQWFIWNWEQCSREQTCGPEVFTGVEVLVTCCEAVEDDINSGVSALTCAEFDEPLEVLGAGFCCKGGYATAGNGDLCCAAGGKVDRRTAILSERIEESNIGKSVYYQYLPTFDGFRVVMNDETNEIYSGVPISGVGTANPNEYKFESGGISIVKKLLFCDRLCSVIVGDEVGVALGDGRCNMPAGDEPEASDDGGAGEPTEGPIIGTTGATADVCEFANLKWLSAGREDLTEIIGKQEIEGGTIPGEDVVLYAELDLDCQGKSITFELNSRGAVTLSPIEGGDFPVDQFYLGDGLAVYRWTPRWQNIESVFDGTRDPEFVFKIFADKGTENQIEVGPSGVLTVKQPPQGCANGVIEVDREEDCDDGDLNDGDGCSSQCKIDRGWYCAGSPSICTTQCGDGIIANWDLMSYLGLTSSNYYEWCDDGNRENGDGCSPSCVIEPGWVCGEEPSICTLCGDGHLRGNEVCDDGNVNTQDGCNAQCVEEFGWSCDSDPSVCYSDCGDGLVASDENCDDGRNNGKPNKCNTECTGNTGSVCRNGVEEDGEECDDGDLNDNDDCTNSCKDAICGDGIIWDEGAGTEMCDDGTNDGSYGTCAPGCVLGPRCGDGNIQTDYEECDDGNRENGDGCSPSCQEEEGFDCPPGEDCSQECVVSNAQWWDSDFNILLDGAHVVGGQDIVFEGEVLRISGEEVTLAVQGDVGCIGRKATFVVYEDEAGIGVDNPATDTEWKTFDAAFETGEGIIIAHVAWEPDWVDDDNFAGADPDPEYYFRVYLFTPDDALKSGNINVDRPELPQCMNEEDDDADLLTDKEDPGCWTNPQRLRTYDPLIDYERRHTSECQDGIDNDGDGLIDGNIDARPDTYDPGCCDDYGVCDIRDNSEKEPDVPECNNKVDDDGDGKIDSIGRNRDGECTSEADNFEFR